MDESVSKKETIEDVGSNVAAAMHTAIRKCCDSRETSAAWSVIHLLRYAWGAYGRLVAELIIRGQDPATAAQNAVSQLQELSVGPAYEQVPWLSWLSEQNGETERWALFGVLRLIKEDDWPGVVAFLDANYVEEIRAKNAVIGAGTSPLNIEEYRAVEKRRSKKP